MAKFHYQLRAIGKMRKALEKKKSIQAMQLREMEQENPKGFILKTREGEFQYNPSSFGEMGRVRPAIQRVKPRMFFPQKRGFN